MHELACFRVVPFDQQVRANLRLTSFRERVAQNVLHQTVGSIPLRARQVRRAAKEAQRNVNAIRRDGGDGRGLAEEQIFFPRRAQAGEILAWLLTRRGVCASNCCVKAGLKVYAKVVTLVFPSRCTGFPYAEKNAARQPRGWQFHLLVHVPVR